MCRAGCIFGSAVGRSVGRRLLVSIRCVVPSQTAADLLKIYVEVACPHLPDQTAVPIAFVPLNQYLPTVRELCKALSGCVAKRLAFLRRIDAGETYLVLPF